MKRKISKVHVNIDLSFQARPGGGGGGGGGVESPC